MRCFRLSIAFVFLVSFGCNNEADQNTLFVRMSPEATGIKFVNEVIENEHFNIMSYEYIYNGNGVAIGDLNNDGLPDVFLTGNMVLNKLYLNKGDFRFEDITEKAGVSGRERWKTGVTMADVNGDGLLDIYICYSGPGTDEARKNELFINMGVQDGIPVFSEKAVEFGLDALGTFSTQGVFFDMDLDGDLDFFLINHADMFYNPFYNTTKLRKTRHPRFGNRLYRNENGRFTDISKEAGIDGSGLNFGLGVSVSDLNNDGWPDILVTNDYNERDFLYLNNRDGTFREVLTAAMGHISQSSMGCDIEDINNDLLPDIMVLDMLAEDHKRQKLLKGPDPVRYALMIDSGYYYQNMRNVLQLNMGLLSDSIPWFSEIGQLAGVYKTDWSWAPLFADFDNDGWKDLFITNGYLRDFTNMDFLKSTFVNEQQKAREQYSAMDTMKLVNGLVTTKLNNYIFSNNGKLRFTNRIKEWGFDHTSISTGAAYADLDNDGDLDLVVCNTNEVVSVYKNQSDKFFKNHFLKVELKGYPGNSSGLGAKVIVSTDSTRQFREMYLTRGYQSSVPPVLHFGLGSEDGYKEVKVIWPDGRVNVVANGKADTLLRFTWESATKPMMGEDIEPQLMFTDYTTQAGIDYFHRKDNRVDDFKYQPLLLYQLSNQGPPITKGDVNGDGLEDVFIGGTVLSRGVLYLQTTGGNFVRAISQPWSETNSAEDGAVLFFDADGDGDLDLLIAKGGVQFRAYGPAYQSELYINDGKGHFTIESSALPELRTSSHCIAVADYDGDGDLDVFIGGRSKPGAFPLSAVSYLLRNESTSGAVKFEYASEQPDQLLRSPGMVTTAAWADINGDGWQDLILGGEFMPITVFENEKGILRNRTEKYGLSESNGLWQKIVLEDMDGDGDVDLIAGNFGLNTQFSASFKEPLSIHYGDFDKNGSYDPVVSINMHGKVYPYNWFDELADQVPSLRKKFPTYEKFSEATFEQLFSKEEMEGATVYDVYELASVYYENAGGQFVRHELPIEAQFSPINSIVVGDWNEDGRKDLALAGNFFSLRPQLGKLDASPGWIMFGNDRESRFSLATPVGTGFFLPGDVRDMVLINEKDKSLFIATRNNGGVSVIKER